MISAVGKSYDFCYNQRRYIQPVYSYHLVNMIEKFFFICQRRIFNAGLDISKVAGYNWTKRKLCGK